MTNKLILCIKGQTEIPFSMCVSRRSHSREKCRDCYCTWPALHKGVRFCGWCGEEFKCHWSRHWHDCQKAEIASKRAKREQVKKWEKANPDWKRDSPIKWAGGVGAEPEVKKWPCRKCGKMSPNRLWCPEHHQKISERIPNDLMGYPLGAGW